MRGGQEMPTPYTEGQPVYSNVPQRTSKITTGTSPSTVTYYSAPVDNIFKPAPHGGRRTRKRSKKSKKSKR